MGTVKNIGPYCGTSSFLEKNAIEIAKINLHSSINKTIGICNELLRSQDSKSELNKVKYELELILHNLKQSEKILNAFIDTDIDITSKPVGSVED